MFVIFLKNAEAYQLKLYVLKSKMMILVEVYLKITVTSSTFQICLITARRQNLMAGISVNLKMAGVLDLASAVKLNKTERNRVLPLSCVTRKKVALYKQGV